MSKLNGRRSLDQDSGRETLAIPDIRSLYYHRDFDGTVSAAMLISIADSPPWLHPVDYHLKPTWAQRRLKKPAAVVDFLFHPDAVLWIDHHADPFVVPAWKEIVPHSRFHVWDTGAPSCPPVIINTLTFPSNLQQHFAPYIHWSSIIDSARYETPEAATDLNNPFLLASEILALSNVNGIANVIANQMAQHNVESVLSHPDVQPLAKRVVETDKRLKTELLSHIRYDGLVAFLDQSFVPSRFQRYYPYLIYPDASYVVGIYRRNNALTISVGANPWKPEPEVNLGLLCRSFGGGGRKNVGGVPATSPSAAKIIAGEIIDKLHKLVPSVPSIADGRWAV